MKSASTVARGCSSYAQGGAQLLATQLMSTEGAAGWPHHRAQQLRAGAEAEAAGQAAGVLQGGARQALREARRVALWQRHGSKGRRAHGVPVQRRRRERRRRLCITETMRISMRRQLLPDLTINEQPCL